MVSGGRGCAGSVLKRGDVRRVNQVSALLDEADGLLCPKVTFSIPGLRVNLGDERGLREVIH